jgi:hypothetical protein
MAEATATGKCGALAIDDQRSVLLGLGRAARVLQLFADRAAFSM